MFHFSTGINSLSTFDPTIQMEDASDFHPAAKHISALSQPAANMQQNANFPGKQAYLYNQSMAMASKLRGSFLY